MFIRAVYDESIPARGASMGSSPPRAVFTQEQLDKLVGGLLTEVSREISEMLGTCLPDVLRHPLGSDEDCDQLSRCIESHRLMASTDNKRFAVAAADGLLAAVHHARHTLRINQDRSGRTPLKQ
jgi:hypothetical protein